MSANLTLSNKVGKIGEEIPADEHLNLLAQNFVKFNNAYLENLNKWYDIRAPSS